MKFRTVAILALVTALSGCGIHTVDTGHRGIKVSFGQVEGPPLTEGLYFVNPFTTSIEQLDVRTLTWAAKTEAYTKDVQEVTIDFTLNYQLDPVFAAETYRTVGQDWATAFVGQAVHQGVKEIVGQWDAVDLIAHRQEADVATGKQIKEALSTKHVIVTGFSLTDLNFTKAFNHAVEAKVIAQQRAIEELNHTEQVKQQAAQRVIAAQAEAQSMKIRADALSQNPKLVEWEAVQKWDGKLPVYSMGGAVPFIQMPAAH